MPTKKRRVGFIPRNDVLNLINKLSHESNLSNSKIINILVEEALHNRGMFNVKTGMLNNDISTAITNNYKKTKVHNVNNEFTYSFKNNLLKNEKLNFNEEDNESLDKEIYAKFLLFLQFQERMKKGNSIE